MPRLEEAFHHDAKDALLAVSDTVGDLLDHFGLADLVLAAIAVRRIDDESMLARTGRLGRLQVGQRLRHGCGIVIRTMRGTAQHQMAIRIALRLRGNHAAVEVDGQEVVFERGRETGIGRRLDRTVGGVLEADRHRQAGGELSVHLAFRVARADRAPADQVADVLRGDRIEPFRGGGQTEVQHVGQHLAGEPHALADIELAVQVGIVDQTLPADRGARLLEIHAHDDDQTILELLLDRGELLRIFMRGLRIMDGARADDGEQTVVPAMQHVANLLTGPEHQIAHLVGKRQLLDEIARSGNRIELTNVDVHGLRKHGILIQPLCILRTIRTAKT